MKKSLLLIAILTSTFAVAVANAATNLITDGTFSNSNVPAADLYTSTSGYYYANGFGGNFHLTNPIVSDNPWIFVDGSGVINGNTTAWGVPAGQQVAFIQSYIAPSGFDQFPSNAPSISQTFTTGTAGNYQLTFDLANRTNWGGTESVNVLIDGVQQGSTLTALSGNLSLYTFSLNALNANTNYTLEFAGVNPSTSDSTVFLDNVNVSAVPEPSEGALLLSGIGLIGFIASRRNRKI